MVATPRRPLTAATHGSRAAGRAATAHSLALEPALERVSDASRAMGGGLTIHVAAGPGQAARAAADAARAGRRVRAWARLLTRHDPESALMRLNADRAPHVRVGPTLCAALGWGIDAARLTDGIVDITLLPERLAAESTAAADGLERGPAAPEDRAWLLAEDRRGGVVTRQPGIRFDLDGVGKGWLADRALRLLDRHPGAVVDADGDIAIRVALGDAWEVGVADPRDAETLLAVLRLDRDAAGPDGRVGVATSGISVHAWPAAPDLDGSATAEGPPRHHLIDRRTGRPADTDVVQATVIAGGAAVAEAWSKSAVILGGAAALARLETAPVRGAVLLLRDGRTVALPRTLRYLA